MTDRTARARARGYHRNTLPGDPDRNDELAKGAEWHVAWWLGIWGEEARRWIEKKGPDPGFDLVLRGRTIDVKWTDRPDPRHYYVNARKVERTPAAVYAFVHSVPYVLKGWCWLADVLASPVVDPYGVRPAHRVPADILRPMLDLRRMPEKEKR